MSSELIFKDIELIFYIFNFGTFLLGKRDITQKENFLNKTELSNHYRFHFRTFLLGYCGAKDPPKNTYNMSSEQIFKDINLILLKKTFLT